MTTDIHYIVQSAAAPMPQSVRVPYKRVAVLAVEAGLPHDFRPTMISKRARGVVAVVQTWERCHQGYADGPNTAYRRALKEAAELAKELNTHSA